MFQILEQEKMNKNGLYYIGERDDKKNRIAD